MDDEIIWSEPAIEDVEAIVSFIGEKSPDTARQIGQGIFAHVRNLRSFPSIGPIYRSSGTEHYREISYKSYRIFYKLVEASHQVEILTVRHSARRGPQFSE
jgi:toxin ParE1/3/4